EGHASRDRFQRGQPQALGRMARELIEHVHGTRALAIKVVDHAELPLDVRLLRAVLLYLGDLLLHRLYPFPGVRDLMQNRHVHEHGSCNRSAQCDGEHQAELLKIGLLSGFADGEKVDANHRSSALRSARPTPTPRKGATSARYAGSNFVLGSILDSGFIRSTGMFVFSWKSVSRPGTFEPPPASTIRPILLSPEVALKKSSERVISPITVSLTVRIACSTSWGTTSWLSSAPEPPSLMRSASSKLMESAFWISSVNWLPPVEISRVKAGTPFARMLIFAVWAPMLTSAITSSDGPL